MLSSVDLIVLACSMCHWFITNASFSLDALGRLLDESVAGKQLATAECIARSDGQTYAKHQ